MPSVGIAIVCQQQRVLVGIRPAGTTLAGLHEFPGGKCLPEETPAACAVRECEEETGLRVTVLELVDHRVHTYPHGQVELSFFLCVPLETNATPHAPFQWVPLDQLGTCQFPDANRDIVQQLIAHPPADV